MDVQLLPVIAIVAAAVFFVARRMYRTFKGRGGGGCAGCHGDCAAPSDCEDTRKV